MPHLCYSGPELLRVYPKVDAPDEVLAPDLSTDSKDGIYQAGLRIAQDMQTAAEKHGRLSHEPSRERTAQAGDRSRTTAPITDASVAMRSVAGRVFCVGVGASFGATASACVSNTAFFQSNTLSRSPCTRSNQTQSSAEKLNHQTLSDIRYVPTGYK